MSTTTNTDTGAGTDTDTETGPGTRGRRLRFLLVVVGGVVLTLGAFSIVSPAAADAAIRSVLAVVGYDWVLVGVVGLAASLLVLAVLVAHVRSGVNQTTPPSPEDVFPVSRFGESFDAFLAGNGGDGVAGNGRHETVRVRLREVAVTAVMRYENCTVSEARERVDSGAWTDDEAAAAFLSASGTPGLAARLRAALTGSSPYRRRARGTAAEIARLDEEASR